LEKIIEEKFGYTFDLGGDQRVGEVKKISLGVNQQQQNEGKND